MAILDPLVTSCLSNIKLVVEEMTQLVKRRYEDMYAISRAHVKMPVMVAHAWNPRVRVDSWDSPIS